MPTPYSTDERPHRAHSDRQKRTLALFLGALALIALVAALITATQSSDPQPAPVTPQPAPTTTTVTVTSSPTTTLEPVRTTDLHASTSHSATVLRRATHFATITTSKP